MKVERFVYLGGRAIALESRMEDFRMKAKVVVTQEKEVDLSRINLKSNTRYWEDFEIDGERSEDGSNVPFRDGSFWTPVIDIDGGRILGWPDGMTAKTHSKVCDECSFEIIDGNGNVVFRQENDYVPSFLSPTESGYGDYIILEIDQKGLIKGFERAFRAWLGEQQELSESGEKVWI